MPAKGQESFLRNMRGQATVELAVAMPVLLAVALVAVNALSFMGECAAFDRLARQAICTQGASPGYGQSSQDCAARIQSELNAAFSRDFESVAVDVEGSSPGLVRYTATISFTPTLLGRSFSGEAFGIHIFPLQHRTSLALDPYKPGAVL